VKPLQLRNCVHFVVSGMQKRKKQKSLSFFKMPVCLLPGKITALDMQMLLKTIIVDTTLNYVRFKYL